MRILITGASGLYGSKMTQITSIDNEVYSAYNKSEPAYGTPIHFDVSNKNQVEHAFNKAHPEVVVHAAALTDVDKCETNKELAWKTNVEGTKVIAKAAKQCKAFLVYVSTDYVFNGEKGSYTETDTPDPVNYYGFTKFKAEQIIEKILTEHCIARTSVIFGEKPASGKINFALWLLSKLRQKEPVKIIVNQWISPTLNTNLAEMTWEIIQRRITGIYHLSGATRISRYDFAQAIAKTFNYDSTRITPSNSSNLNWTARRPRDSSLNVEKAKKKLTKKPLPVSEALSQLACSIEAK